MGPTPVVVDVSDAVTGQPSDTVDTAAAGMLVAAAVDPDPDIHATAEYRRQLAATLTVRAVAAAANAAERPP